MVFPGVPLGESRELLRDGREETNDDTDGNGLHVVAEFLDGALILNITRQSEIIVTLSIRMCLAGLKGSLTG